MFFFCAKVTIFGTQQKVDVSAVFKFYKIFDGNGNKINKYFSQNIYWEIFLVYLGCVF